MRPPGRAIADDLTDVRDTGGADRMTLGEQTAARVHGGLAACCCIATLEGLRTAGVSAVSSQGLPISSRVRVPPAHTFGVVRETLALIDAVHGDGELPELPIRFGQAHIEHGGYRHTRDGRPLSLTVSRFASEPRLTIMHEIGHFLDHHGLGAHGTFASESGRITSIMNAINRSDAVSRLQAMQRRQQVLVKLSTGKRVLHRLQRRYLSYLLEPRELFARAYAQHIALVTSQGVMRQEMPAIRADVLRGQVYHVQWDDNDFVPIADEIDTILRRRGWRG